MNILLVEDNKGDAVLIREYLAESLIDITFNLNHAERLSEAMEELNKGSFNIILLDLGLPDSLGLDTFRKLSEYRSDIPIVVLTGMQNDSLGEKAIQAGAQDFLIKSSINSLLLSRTIKYAIERHNYKATIIESENRLRTIIDNNSDGILVISQDGIVHYVNPAALNLFGRQNDEMLGQMFGFPISSYEHSEITILRKNFEQIVVEMRITDIVWKGNPCYLASLRDVSERKKADALIKEYSKNLEEIIENRNLLFKIISHDLRSPFTGLLGFSEILYEEFETMEKDEMKALIESNYHSMKSIYELINNLLSWANIQQENIVLEKTSFNINTLVNKVFRIFKSNIELKNHTFEINISECKEILTDYHLLFIVLRNLISNAIKFTPENGRIVISVIKNNNQILFSIADSGVGMSDEIWDKKKEGGFIFTTKGTNNEMGSGLGIVLCKDYINKLGGKIWVESEKGKGTTFFFTLPMK